MIRISLLEYQSPVVEGGNRFFCQHSESSVHVRSERIAICSAILSFTLINFTYLLIFLHFFHLYKRDNKQCNYVACYYHILP